MQIVKFFRQISIIVLIRLPNMAKFGKITSGEGPISRGSATPQLKGQSQSVQVFFRYN